MALDHRGSQCSHLAASRTTPPSPQEVCGVRARDPQNQDVRVLHNAICVVWPRRGEHDKGPDELMEIADQWSQPLNLPWMILGEHCSIVPMDKAIEDRVLRR